MIKGGGLCLPPFFFAQRLVLSDDLSVGVKKIDVLDLSL